jgi:hypothetical protein
MDGTPIGLVVGHRGKVHFDYNNACCLKVASGRDPEIDH